MKDRRLLTIFLIVFVDLLGFGLILPLLPYIAETFKANPLEIGLLSATYSFFQFISAPILGRLSDRFGRKRLLIFSQLGSLAGFLLLGFAKTLPGLFVSRLIDGMTGGNISIAQAYIADVTKPQDRAKGMGVIGAAFGLGFILGPVLGGILSQWGFAVPAFFAAGVSLVTVVTTGLFLRETVDPAKARRSPHSRFALVELQRVMRIQPLGLLIVVFFLINTAFSGLQGTFALWTQHTYNWGPRQSGYLFAYIGVLSVIFQLKMLPLITKRIGERSTLIYSVPLLAIGLVGIPLAVHVGLLLITMGLIVAGNSLANPTIQAIASEQVKPEEYGGTLGFLQASASLGRIVGPILGGELYNVISKDAPYIASGLILIICYMILEKYLPQPQPLYKRVLNRLSR